MSEQKKLLFNKKNGKTIINKKQKLLNTNKNKRLISLHIENFFLKSNLNSLELSYNNKISNMKNLLLNFHILYNSLNQIKSSLNKEKSNTKKSNISNNIINSNQKSYLVIKKQNSNVQLNKIYNRIAEENNNKNDITIKKIKSYKNSMNDKNNYSLNENILKTDLSENIFNEKSKIKKITENKCIKDKKYKIYNFSSYNQLRKTIVNSNAIKNKLIKDKNHHSIYYKIKYNEKNPPKKLFISDSFIEKNFKINNTSSNIIKHNKISIKNKNGPKHLIRNFNSLNIKSLSLLTDFNNKLYKEKNSKIKLNSSHQKKEVKNNVITKSFIEDKNKYSFQNKSKKIYLDIMNTKIISQGYSFDCEWKNISNNFLVNEEDNKLIKKNNKIFMFFIEPKNYEILQKIYDFLYKNENIREGDKNILKNIKGPFRDIYLNKCLSLINGEYNKFEMKKKNQSDIWTIMQKEILIHQLSKINGFIRDNNNNFEISTNYSEK